MLFNSIFFLLVFLPIVVFLYFILPYKFRWILLLMASFYFYASFIPKYLLLVIFILVIDYFSGILIERFKNKIGKKIVVISCILLNMGILFYYKYFNFIINSVNKFFEAVKTGYHFNALDIILPIGISFLLFQSLGYVIDVYRKDIKAEKHLGYFSLFVMFFPQLVAGPIERASNLLGQLKEKHDFDYKRFIDGVLLLLFGLFKKVVIADRAAFFVNNVYNNIWGYEGVSFIFATVFFAFQIYCDFSGYSDMAIGMAKILGINLMKNFDDPYASRSISEFWKRWHISLSTWFKDYLYIPLGGNRVSKFRNYLNLFITFTISGMWHGANWTFFIWGALNGIYLILGKIKDNILEKFRKKKSENIILDKINNIKKIIITFSLTCFAWVFFRANGLSNVKYIMIHTFFSNNFLNKGFFPGQNLISLSIVVISIILMQIVYYFIRKKSFERSSYVLRIFGIFILLFLVLLFGEFYNNQFIYFQF